MIEAEVKIQMNPIYDFKGQVALVAAREASSPLRCQKTACYLLSTAWAANQQSIV